LMTAKRDQTSAMLMIERQNRTETELLLRDTHARLEQERKEVFVSRSKIATLNEQLECARGELVQQTSLAVDRAARLKTMDVEFTTLRREHDVLLDEKRAWTFSKLDLEAKTEEARVVTQLREKIADVEDLLTSRNAEVAEARRTVRGSVMVVETVYNIYIVHNLISTSFLSFPLLGERIARPSGATQSDHEERQGGARSDGGTAAHFFGRGTRTHH
jgi:hypothetical protein